MKTEVTLEQAIGKTLQGIEASYTCGQMVLAFTDGTFTALGVSRGHERGDETIDGESLELHHFGDEALIRLGVTTNEELSEIRSTRDAERAAANRLQQDARDQAEFLRLKLKFEA